MEQLTAEGRVFKTADGAASAWAYGSSSAKTLTNEEAFVNLMKTLFVGCSFTVRQGRVVGITLRPQSSGGRGASATGLSAELLDALDVTVGATLRQNAREGKKTDDGATLTVSARLTKFSVDLGAAPTSDRTNSEGFLTLNGSRATLNPRAQEGACAKIGVDNPDGSWRTLTFVKRDRRIIEIVYRTNDALNRNKRNKRSARKKIRPYDFRITHEPETGAKRREPSTKDDGLSREYLIGNYIRRFVREADDFFAEALVL